MEKEIEGARPISVELFFQLFLRVPVAVIVHYEV
jgi:hypothetical protein